MSVPAPRSALSVLLVGVLLGGCSGAGQQRQSTPISHARLAAYAHAVNLRGGDVPGATAHSPEGFDLPGEHVTVAFDCSGGGVVGTRETVHSPEFISSALFEPPRSRSRVSFQAVASSVQLERGPAVATGDVAADRKRSVERCLGDYFNAAQGARGPLVDNRATIEPLSLTLPVASFAFSATTREHYKSAQPQPRQPNSLRSRLEQARSGGITIDHFGFASGRCVITLFVAHKPGERRRGEERRLLRLLYDRARAHPPLD